MNDKKLIRPSRKAFALALSLSLAAGPGLTDPSAARAAGIPQSLNYQGKLGDASGNPLSGSYCFQLKVWDALTGGSLLFGPETWSATGTAANSQVSVANGIYSVQIGSLTAGGIAPDVFASSSAFLEVLVSNDAANCTSPETLSPRERLAASAYAFHALTAETLGTGVNIATFTSAGLMTFPFEVRAGSASFISGVTASSGTFTNTSASDSFSLKAGTSSTAAHLFVSTTGFVGIGTTTPTARLDVNGDAKIARYLTQANDGGVTLTTADFGKTITVNSGSAQTVTLPSVTAADIGATFTVVKLGAGKVTIAAAASTYIADSTSGGTLYNNAVSPAYATITIRLISATQWMIISGDGAWVTT